MDLRELRQLDSPVTTLPSNMWMDSFNFDFDFDFDFFCFREWICKDLRIDL